MQTDDAESYRERCVFQRELDETFPRGAMCAVLEETDGHLRGAYLLAATGRLFCSGIHRSDDGTWEYEVLIDSRGAPTDESEPVRLWTSGPIRRSPVPGLFQMRVVSAPGEAPQLLRLNANPPAHLRPSKRTRSFMTSIHERVLFPGGLESQSEDPVPAA